jgi:hypothetical protein
MFVTDERANTEEERGTDRLRGWVALATAVNAAIAVCWMMCKVPEARTLSWRERFIASSVYLLVACLAGAAATWLVLSRSSREQFRGLARCGVRGWVYLPAIVLFLHERSVWAPFLAMVSAGLMAVWVYRMKEVNPSEAAWPGRDVEKGLFSLQVRLAPTSWVPFGLSGVFYGAVISAVSGRIVLLTLLSAAGMFLSVLQIVAIEAQAKKARLESAEIGGKPHTYSLIAVAFGCAVIALSVASGASPFVGFLGWGSAYPSPDLTKREQPPDHLSSGYRAIVLWPVVKEEKVVPSPPLNAIPMSLGVARPWVIPFNGPYWYFKVQGDSPGANAYVRRGDPLKARVRSTDSGTLLMEAHQQLSDSIDLACCREMRIVFRNDVSLGAFAVGIVLTDSHPAGRMSENLGVKYVASSATDRGPVEASAAEQTLTFPFPKPGLIRRFDAITVVLLPDPRYLTAGRRVAVERFVMIPN